MTFDKQVFYFATLSEYAESQEKSRQLIEEQRLLKTHLERLGFDVVLSAECAARWNETERATKP